MRKLIWALGAAKFNLVTYWGKRPLCSICFIFSSVFSARAFEPHVTAITDYLKHHKRCVRACIKDFTQNLFFIWSVTLKKKLLVLRKGSETFATHV